MTGDTGDTCHVNKLLKMLTFLGNIRYFIMFTIVKDIFMNLLLILYLS